MMVKTKASVCHKCNGKGKIHKIKKDGTPFAKPIDALSVIPEGIS